MKALLVIAALAGVASAGPKVDPAVQAKADALFVKGQASYQDGKYQEAIAQFKQAYILVADPVYLFNIGQSYRKVGDCVAALDSYSRYLEVAPNAENRDKVKQWLTELKPCVDQRHAEQEAAARQAQEAAQRRQAEPRAPHAETRDSGLGYRLGGIALAGAGAVGIGIGVAYGIRGRDLRAQVATQCANSCQWDSEMIQDLDGAGRAANTAAWIGYIAGGVAVVGGVALYFYGRTRIETVMVGPTPGGAAVSARMRF